MCRTAEVRLAGLMKVKDIPDNKKPLVQKWLTEFGFSVDVIYDAYQLALEATGTVEYKYMDKVLVTWHKHGIGASDPAWKKQSDTFRVHNKKNATDSKQAVSPQKYVSFDLDRLDREIMEEYRSK
jgi:DnaD/phage-associated family protein